MLGAEKRCGTVVGNVDLCRDDWERLIDQWIFSERDRKILKRRLLDGITYERLEDEFQMSVRNLKNIVYKAEKILIKHV